MPLLPKHLHTYKMVPHQTRTDIYMCMDAHCSHRINKQYLEGKAAECPTCGAEFTISKVQLTRKRKILKCGDCKTRATFGGKVIKPIGTQPLDLDQLGTELEKII